MSIPEHQRSSAIEDLRLKCADGLADLAVSRWRWVGVLIIAALLAAAVVIGLDRANSGGAVDEAQLPKASTTSVVGGHASAHGEDFVVQVAGAVSKPGVYRISGTSRLVDVIELAGGLTPEADRDRVNLAAKVVDGQSVYVARLGQNSIPQASSSSSPSETGGGESGPIDINTASESELKELPGVGPATAKAIVEHRARSGPFKSVDELGKVRGIGPSKLEQLRNAARV